MPTTIRWRVSLNAADVRTMNSVDVLAKLYKLKDSVDGLTERAPMRRTSGECAIWMRCGRESSWAILIWRLPTEAATLRPSPQSNEPHHGNEEPAIALSPEHHVQ